MTQIVISGNIGSGKTTLLKELNERLSRTKYTFINEPVDVWKSIKDKDGINTLQHFYNDPRKNAFNLQMLSLITRIEELKKASEKEGKILVGERCLWEDREIFAKMLTDDGFITPIEYETYKYYFKAFKVKEPTTIFYINTSPSECLRRIKKRGRPEEQNIKLEYLVKLDRYYLEWVCKSTEFDVFFINGNNTTKQIADYIINQHL
tara:strand:- start:170 stop:787 length:618 start_codon:yes stop_codon:yes gene_type:complete